MFVDIACFKLGLFVCLFVVSVCYIEMRLQWLFHTFYNLFL